jgi:hypothetical protein
MMDCIALVQIRKKDVDTQSGEVGPVYRTDLANAMEATHLALSRYAPFVQWIESTSEEQNKGKSLAAIVDIYLQSMKNLYRTEIRRFFTHTKCFIAHEPLGSMCVACVQLWR